MFRKHPCCVRKYRVKCHVENVQYGDRPSNGILYHVHTPHRREQYFLCVQKVVIWVLHNRRERQREPVSTVRKETYDGPMSVHRCGIVMA